MTSLLADFAAAVARTPERVAIVDGTGRETTFAALMARSEGLARAWATQGIGPGDRVLLAMHLNSDLYASLAALWSLGATVVLPEPAMGLAGLRHAARTEGIVAFCSSGAYGALKYLLPALWPLRHLRPIPLAGESLRLSPPQETDIALISFTSGTTGAPKAIPRSHAFLGAQHRAVAPLLQSDQVERDLVAFPVFVLINIASGRTSVLPNWKMSRLARLDPAALAAWVTDQRITRALIPPALCDTLAQTAVSPALHTVFTGGGPVFPNTLAKLAAAGPALNVICVYGSTEAEPIAHLDAGDIGAEDLSAMMAGKGLLVGRPVPEIRLRIVDDEVQVAGAHVNPGYLNPAQDAEIKVRDGGTIWHRTGDAGFTDGQGRLWLLGRVGSQIAMDGGSRYPFSVEVAAHSWPGVAQCALMPSGEGGLVIEGDVSQMEIWKAQAAAFGITRVMPVAKIPMDLRHASKIDRKALAKRLGPSCVRGRE